MRLAGSRGPKYVSVGSVIKFTMSAYLELNFGLGNISLAAASAGNLLCLSNLVPDSLS